MTLTLRAISTPEHLAYIRRQESASYLQTPAWAKVKDEWRHESLGWFNEEGILVGAGLVLYRQLPKIRRYLAYLPEGPLIDWRSDDIGAWLKPLAAYLKGAGAFGIRIGPIVAKRRWHADTIKAAIADSTITRLSDAAPDEFSVPASNLYNQLRVLRWRPPRTEDGFAAGQPQFVFQLPLAGKTEQDLLAGMNQLWRRNIKKAEKLGVSVATGSAEDLPAFHALYLETAERGHFSPRALSYFQTMFAALEAEDPDRIRLYLARHEGDLVGATIWVRVGTHAWYSYGASSTAKREVRASNAIQWQMIKDAHAAGAHVYDLRGITEGLEADDPHLGLIQFKVGTGGEAVEYLGEWDLPLNRALYTAFDFYLRRR